MHRVPLESGAHGVEVVALQGGDELPSNGWRLVCRRPDLAGWGDIGRGPGHLEDGDPQRDAPDEERDSERECGDAPSEGRYAFPPSRPGRGGCILCGGLRGRHSLRSRDRRCRRRGIGRGDGLARCGLGVPVRRRLASHGTGCGRGLVRGRCRCLGGPGIFRRVGRSRLRRWAGRLARLADRVARHGVSTRGGGSINSTAPAPVNTRQAS